MWKPLKGLAVMASCMGVLACDENVSGPEPAPAHEQTLENLLAEGSTASTSEADAPAGIPLFDQLAAQILEFGGLYRNGRCSVMLVLTDLTHADRAEDIVQETLERILDRGCAEGVRVDSVEGDYTYLELKRWLGAARPLHRIRGVLTVAIDFSRNRIVVTVVSHAAANAVLDALPQLGIPAEAVIFEAGSGR